MSKGSTAFDFRQLYDLHFIFALLIGPVVWGALWILASGSGVSLSLMLLFRVVLLYPLLEELAFRGFLQGWLLEYSFFRRKWLGISTANLLTSIIFAVAHLISQPLLWAASVFFPSLVFGYFRDRHQSIVTACLLHSWYNAGFLIVMYG